MFIKDSIGNIERHSIYLSKPSGELLGCLDEFIDELSANLTRGLNQQLQLSFEINRLDNGWYEYIQEGMYLVVDTVGIFKMKQPQISNNGSVEIKNVIAFSCDNELEDKNIDLEINMGTKTSQEYLVVYDPSFAEEELINPYTGVPYDWLVLYNMFPEQLTKHLYDYDHGEYGTNYTEDMVITEGAKIKKLNDLFTLIPRLKNKFIKTADSDTGSINYELIEYVDITYNSFDDSIYSITLYPEYRDRITYLIDFYSHYREQLSLLSVVLEKTHGAWKVGDIFGVSDGDYTLANRKYQFEISENIYSFLTTTLAQTTNCMVTFDIFNRKVNLTPVENIGKDTGIVLSYDNLLNSLGIDAEEDNLSTRLIVTGNEDLSIEQVNFGLDYIDDLSYKMNAIDENGQRIYVSDTLATKYANYVERRENLRAEYIQLAKDYRKYSEQIDEINNRVPLDDLKTDWGTFSEEELTAALTAYKNLLASLISIYRSEYYPDGLNDDGSVNEDFMRTTVYWNDYSAYQSVITEIECAISTFPYYSDHDKWSDYDKARYEEAIIEWETEWTLYGIEELQAKIAAYKNNMDVLAESSVIKVSADSDAIKSWNQLSSSEKTEFGNISENYKYDEYMSYYENMLAAKDYLEILQQQVSNLEGLRTATQTRRTDISMSVSWENNFTSRECKEMSLLIREADCSNDNILVTNIDTGDTKIDKMQELLEYGQEQLSIMCRPQLTFTISSDNLLALTDFESFWSDFEVGNFILVQYRDDTYIKLRMVEYEYNPCLPSSDQFKITFSNMVRSKVGVTDLESLLGLSSTSSGRSGSSSGGGGRGTYGESDDIDITISNTMLAKLLNSELFGTRVQDVILNTIDVNAITARYAKFDGLANGVTIIDGQCITTGWIKSLDYNGSEGGAIDNTVGSILNLNTGNFNFGGGRITFNGSTLNVNGHIVATTLATGGRASSATGHDGMYVDSQGNIYSGSNNGVIIYKDGTFNFANGKITYNGVLTTIASDVVIGSDTVAQAWSDIATAQATADGKTKVYYGTVSTILPPTYDLNEGDYLVDDTTGCTYRWDAADEEWIIATDYETAIDEAIEEIIIPQIDAKIETWVTSSNPASDWSVDDYARHKDDLWLYTGLTDILISGATIHPQGIYKFTPLTSTDILEETGVQITDELGEELVLENGYIWEDYSSVSANIFDLADGKSTIYYGTPSETYENVEVGDYLVDPTDGSTYKWDGSLWAIATNYTESIDTAINSLRNTLEEQIDGKVETWAQITDPSADWEEEDIPSHDGDLWFYIGTTDSTVEDSLGNKIKPSKTYQYDSNTEKWVLYDSPSRSLFDLADGKATVYYGAPTDTFTPSPELGDYLVDETDADGAGCTYKYVEGNIWQKVTDYKGFTQLYTSEAIGVAKEDLESQIDAKIETWSQSTNPALNWTLESYKTHDGDLWLYTGLTDITINGITIHPQGIYQFEYVTSVDILDELGNKITDEAGVDLETEISYTWKQYSSYNTNIFDMADGKSTIFYGSVSGTYIGVSEGDYLVDSTNGTTYRRIGNEWSPVTKTGDLYGVCSSLATASEKIVTCNESISVYDGLTLAVRFEHENTFYNSVTPLTLNVGKLGVRNIYYNGEKISSTNRMYWSAGATIRFMFDGVGWIVIGHPQTYSGKCTTAASTASKTCAITDAVIVKGTVVNLTFSYANSVASPTLNVINNSANAPTITVDSSDNPLGAASQYNWNDGATVGFTFDGQYWKLNDSSALYNTNSYMRFESSGTAQGLMIANMRNGIVSNSAITTPNTLLTSTDLRIRNGQTVLAKFGSSIELASSGATITVGNTGSYHTVVNSEGMTVKNGIKVLASFGTNVTVGATGDGYVAITSNGVSIYDNNSSEVFNITSQYSNRPFMRFADMSTDRTYYDSTPYTPGHFGISFGNHTMVMGDYSLAEGCFTSARGHRSHAEGCTTLAGCGTHPRQNRETGYAHAEGHQTQAWGDCSHAQNESTIASGNCQTAIGRYNLEDTSVSASNLYGTYAFIIGNGYYNGNDWNWASSTSLQPYQQGYGPDKNQLVKVNTGMTFVRRNAFTVDWNGNIQYAGTSSKMSSDKRLKKHINYLGEEAIEFIRNLKPAHFIRNNEHHPGFYAQDVQAVDPWHSLIGEMNDYLTLDYLKIIAPLVAYCQYLESRIKNIEGE